MNRNNILQLFLLFTLTLILSGCKKSMNISPSNPKNSHQMNENIFSGINKNDLGDFKWLNEPEDYNIEDGQLKVVAEKETDFFNNPEDGKKTSTAHLFYKEINEDFVAVARVRPDFSSLWNAVAMMVHIDDDNWIKFAFENSDATGISIVSVVTRDVSDDANGVIMKGVNQIWLKLIRKGNNYSMHWSKDGIDYKMARLSALTTADSVKIGIEVQCPVGESAIHQIDYFEIAEISVGDLRKGI